MTGGSDTGVGAGSGFGEAVFGDYDNDGYLDIYIVNSDANANILYRNNGDGTLSIT